MHAWIIFSRTIRNTVPAKSCNALKRERFWHQIWVLFLLFWMGWVLEELGEIWWSKINLQYMFYNTRRIASGRQDIEDRLQKVHFSGWVSRPTGEEQETKQLVNSGGPMSCLFFWKGSKKTYRASIAQWRNIRPLPSCPKVPGSIHAEDTPYWRGTDSCFAPGMERLLRLIAHPRRHQGSLVFRVQATLCSLRRYRFLAFSLMGKKFRIRSRLRAYRCHRSRREGEGMGRYSPSWTRMEKNLGDRTPGNSPQIGGCFPKKYGDEVQIPARGRDHLTKLRLRRERQSHWPGYNLIGKELTMYEWWRSSKRRKDMTA